MYHTGTHMNDRTRALALKTIIQQERQRPSQLKASIEYLAAYPQNKRLVGKNILVGTIVGNTKPSGVWYTNHAQTRTKGGKFSALTRENIETIVKHGQYLPNRLEYTRHNGTVASNTGKIAGKVRGTCPTRRIKYKDGVAVLSFCYPRGVTRHPMWWPDVVTAYRGRK